RDYKVTGVQTCALPISLRPNQIFALALPFPLIEGEAAQTLVDAVGRALFTSYGLRSLTPDDPAYRGGYGGDQYERDTSYHQGPRSEERRVGKEGGSERE